MKKFLGFVFGMIFFTIITISAAAMIGYAYVYKTYGIDVIKTVQALQGLNDPVDETKLCPNAYTADDMVNVQSIVNKSVDGFITSTEDGGYHINFDNLPTEMTEVIKLSDKQVCAVAHEVVEQEINGKFNFGDKQVSVALKQIDFYDVTEDSAHFNVVISVDMTPFKQLTDNEWANNISTLIPDTMYVSSTVIVVHGADNFSYDVKHESLTINNMTKEQTQDLFHVLEVLFKTDSLAAWNVYVGETIMHALVGSETQQGLAYGLKDIGATDYAFVAENGVEYYVVERQK
jgi:hypothetical protein